MRLPYWVSLTPGTPDLCERPNTNDPFLRVLVPIGMIELVNINSAPK